MTSSSETPADEEARTPRAIVAGHGSFAEGLVSAVHQIAGIGGIFHTLTNSGLGLEEMQSQLRSAVEATGARVIFTDLPGGSATMAVRRLMRERVDLVLVTGANLAALLEFAFHEQEGVLSAARLAAEKGRAALDSSGGG